MEKLEDFLQAEYLKWMVSEGKKKSQNEFAKWLGVSPGSLSQWMNGMRNPTGGNIHVLAEKLGPKIYDILDQPPLMPKDERFRQIAEYWYEFDDDQKNRLLWFIGELKRGNI